MRYTVKLNIFVL